MAGSDEFHLKFYLTGKKSNNRVSRTFLYSGDEKALSQGLFLYLCNYIFHSTQFLPYLLFSIKPSWRIAEFPVYFFEEAHRKPYKHFSQMAALFQ